MNKKNISYFLRPNDEPKIVEIEAPPSIKDENGKPVMMQVRVLKQEEIDHIYDNYTTKRTATDGKKKPIVEGGEIVFRKDRDSGAAMRHVVAEALVFPDLKSQEVMDYYKCYDISEILYKVFPYTDEFNYVITEVLKALGISADEEEEDDYKAAKN